MNIISNKKKGLTTTKTNTWKPKQNKHANKNNNTKESKIIITTAKTKTK